MITVTIEIAEQQDVEISHMDALQELSGLLAQTVDAEWSISGIVKICEIISERPDAADRKQVIESSERLLQIVMRMRAVAELL
jgi:hypothetical protein